SHSGRHSEGFDGLSAVEHQITFGEVVNGGHGGFRIPHPWKLRVSYHGSSRLLIVTQGHRRGFAKEHALRKVERATVQGAVEIAGPVPAGLPVTHHLPERLHAWYGHPAS